MECREDTAEWISLIKILIGTIKIQVWLSNHRATQLNILLGTIVSIVDYSCI
jgi:hypothetical protein